MIQATRSPLVHSPFTPPPVARRPAEMPAEAPRDQVTMSAASPSPPPGRSWKAVGLAVLLAAPLGGALSMAEAHEWNFPASTSTVCTLPPNVSLAPASGPQDGNRMQRDIFDANVSSLQRQGSFVEQLAKRGSFKDGSCTVTVSDGGAHVEMADSDHGAVIDTRNGERSVTIRQGDLEQTLHETPRERTVTSGMVSRSLYLQDGDGHRAGDFSILIRDGSR